MPALALANRQKIMTRRMLIRIANRIKKELEESGIGIKTVNVIDLDRDVPRHILSLRRADYVLRIELEEGKNLIVIVEETEVVKLKKIRQINSTIQGRELVDIITARFKVNLRMTDVIGIIHATKGVGKCSLIRMRSGIPYYIANCENELVVKIREYIMKNMLET